MQGVPAKARSASVDVVRVIGLLAVVAGHVTIDGAIRPALYTWHVPLFFVLMGYFWSPDRTLGTEVRNRWKSTILPAAVWGFGILVVYSIARGAGLGFEEGGLLPMPAYLAYWFIAVLVFVAILRRLLARAPAWVAWVLGVLGLVAAYFAGALIAEMPLFVGLALPSLVFVLFGESARRHRKRLKPWMAGVALIVSAVLISTTLSRPLDIKAGDFGTPVLSVVVALAISVSLIVLSEKLVPKLSASIKAVATILATTGLPVLLGHAAIIMLLKDYEMPLVLVFFAAALIPWSIGLFASRSALSPLIVGMPRRARANKIYA